MKAISIYIVEDELLISASLKSQLQNFGYQILGASTRGETCLQEVEQLSSEGKEPEIILMDIHLRGQMDGIETAKKINEKFNCGIIFLTGQSTKEVYERSFKIKPFGYLLKPIDMEQMKMTIEIAAYQRNLELENKEYQKSLEVLLNIRTREKNEIMDLYQTIIENSPIGLTIMQEEKFVYANQRTAEIFGYSLDEWLCLTIQDIIGLFHPEDRLKVIETSRVRLDGKELPGGMLIRIIRKDGQIRWLETNVKMILYKGNPALHQTFLDVTEFKINQS